MEETPLDKLIREEKIRILDGVDCPLKTKDDRGIAKEKVRALESSREFLASIIKNYNITEPIDRTFIWDFVIILLEAYEECSDTTTRVAYIQAQIPDFVMSFRRRLRAN